MKEAYPRKYSILMHVQKYSSEIISQSCSLKSKSLRVSRESSYYFQTIIPIIILPCTKKSDMSQHFHTIGMTNVIRKSTPQFVRPLSKESSAFFKWINTTKIIP